MIHQEEGHSSGVDQSGPRPRSWWARRDYGFHTFLLLCLGWFIAGLLWWLATGQLIGIGLLAAGAGMALLAIGFSLGYDRVYPGR